MNSPLCAPRYISKTNRKLIESTQFGRRSRDYTFGYIVTNEI
jgi:hypothetical protein